MTTSQLTALIGQRITMVWASVNQIGITTEKDEPATEAEDSG